MHKVDVNAATSSEFYEVDTPIKSVEQRSTLIPAASNSVSAIPLESRWTRYSPTLLSLIVSLAWVSATIWLSFATGYAKPIIPSPSTTIIVLNVFSTGSTFLLGQAVGQTFEHLRWTLASNRKGIGLATFLGLGSSSSSIGVLDSMLWKPSTAHHRSWCAQRLLSYTSGLITGCFIF